MNHGEFLWCDLSSFRPETTQAFYTALLGWRFDGTDYAIAATSSGPVAGLFQMPDKFIQIGMPSFWMSYMAVADVEAAVETARAHGGKVEVGPASTDTGGRYALIRDPVGAGFTVYEVSDLHSTATGPGARLGHGLFVSDAAAVTPFYSALFGWQFKDMAGGVFAIQAQGQTIAHLHEIPDPNVRGKEEFWAVFFAGKAERVASLGGEVVAEVALPEGPATLVRDPDGAAFFLLSGGAAPHAAAPTPWFAWGGLGLIALAIVTGWGWITTLFFAVWVITGLRDRATYLFETVSRDRHPTLYWLILATYALLGVVALFVPV